MKLRAYSCSIPSAPPFALYSKWCGLRGVAVPPVFAHGRASEFVWVESERCLVLGVALFASPAFLMADFLMTNPEASLLERYRATKLALDVFIGSAVSRGLTPLAHPRTRGVARVLERKGFEAQPVATMVRQSVLSVTFREKKKEPKKPTRRVGPRRRSAKKK